MMLLTWNLLFNITFVSIVTFVSGVLLCFMSNRSIIGRSTPIPPSHIHHSVGINPGVFVLHFYRSCWAIWKDVRLVCKGWIRVVFFSWSVFLTLTTCLQVNQLSIQLCGYMVSLLFALAISVFMEGEWAPWRTCFNGAGFKQPTTTATNDNNSNNNNNNKKKKKKKKNKNNRNNKNNDPWCYWSLYRTVWHFADDDMSCLNGILWRYISQ